jgi:hypothetical protein
LTIVQTHRIKHQVIELTVRDATTARQLHNEISRIYHQRIVPLIDYYCSELSTPGQLHRIETLVLDVGSINVLQLEADLVAGVEAALRPALAAQMNAPAARPSGYRSDVQVWLELFALFARSGSLPWWADATAPRLLEDGAQHLLQHAPAALARLLRTLAHEPQALQRLVDHLSDPFLTELARELVPALQAAPADQFPSLIAALQHNPVASSHPQAWLRRQAWMTILQVAGIPSRKDPKLGKAARAAKAKRLQLQREKMGARRAHTEGKDTMEREVKDAIEAAWIDYGNVLGPNLMPVGFVFGDRPFTGNTSSHTYHTGAQTDPIPIVWYKAPTDYPAVVVGGVDHSLMATSAGSVSVGNKRLGVADANKPRISPPPTFMLRKVAHHDNRAGQQAFNIEFNTSGAGVRLRNGTVRYNALGAGGFDGDHVKDLGFNGTDTEDNYWPLEAAINRRAFNGYNSGYIVNYLDTHVAPHTHKAKSIGGMIGKYFRVKGYMPNNPAQNIPRESDTEYAGTDDIQP